MQTIHLCVLILVRIKGETNISPPVIFLLTVPRWSVFVDIFFCYFCLYLPYCHVCFCCLVSPAGKELTSCDVFLWFLSFSLTVSWVRCGT